MEYIVLLVTAAIWVHIALMLVKVDKLNKEIQKKNRRIDHLQRKIDGYNQEDEVKVILENTHFIDAEKIAYAVVKPSIYNNDPFIWFVTDGRDFSIEFDTIEAAQDVFDKLFLGICNRL